ncbi:SH3 domain protein, partial [Opisthorchis viverrini]
MTTKPAELVIAKFDYKAADSHELGIQKGERLTVLDDTQKWWRVMNAQGATGYVPSNYVKRSKQGIFSSLRNTLGRGKSRHEGSITYSLSGKPNSSPIPDNNDIDGRRSKHGSVDSLGDKFHKLNSSADVLASSGFSEGDMLSRSAATTFNRCSNAVYNPRMEMAKQSRSMRDPLYDRTHDFDNVRADGWGSLAIHNPQIQSSAKRPISSQGGQTSTQNGRHEHLDSQRFPPSVLQPEVSETPTVGLLICQALFAYPANQPDELSIERGDRIQVVEKSSDGWWRGVLVDQDRQSRMGWFPSNYVTLDLSKNLARSKTTAARETTMNSVPGVHPSQAPLPIPSAAVTGQTALQGGQMLPSVSKPVTIVERVLTLYPFTRNQNEELSFDTNEVLEIIEKPPDDPDWWRCRNARGETGLVPRNYVSLLPSGPASSLGEHAVPQDTGQFSFPVQPTEPGQSSASEELRLTYAVSSTTTHAHMEQPWFWGSISRAECESMLTQFGKPGEFVIRDSESHPGDLTVTMNAGSKARNFKVRMERGQYHIGQKVFPSVNELIQHYCTHPIFKNESEKLYLTRPFKRTLSSSTVIPFVAYSEEPA